MLLRGAVLGFRVWGLGCRVKRWQSPLPRLGGGGVSLG